MHSAAGDLVSQYSTYARQDPVAFVSLLESMPPEASPSQNRHIFAKCGQLVIIADLACAGAEGLVVAGWRHNAAKEGSGKSVCSTCFSGQAAGLL